MVDGHSRRLSSSHDHLVLSAHQLNTFFQFHISERIRRTVSVAVSNNVSSQETWSAFLQFQIPVQYTNATIRKCLVPVAQFSHTPGSTVWNAHFYSPGILGLCSLVIWLRGIVSAGSEMTMEASSTTLRTPTPKDLHSSLLPRDVVLQALFRLFLDSNIRLCAKVLLD